MSTPFDLDLLLQRCMGNRDLAIRLLAIYREQAVKDLEELEKCIRSGDREDATRIAHSLKGASANLTAESIRALAAELEMASRAGKLEPDGDYLNPIRAEWERLLDYLPKVLG